MMKSIAIATSFSLAVLSASPMAAGGFLGGLFQSSPTGPVVFSEMPPSGYEAQWWTNAKGCTYSRTGRPGEISWTVHRHTLKRGCALYFVQQPWNGRTS